MNDSIYYRADFLMRIQAYYPTWSIYARNYQLQDIPCELITHLTIAFAKINVSGIVSWEEIEKLDIKTIKLAKIGIVIGGWGNHEEFATALKSTKTRAVFVESCVEMVQKFNLNYIEMDWEFPSGVKDVEAYLKTSEMLRNALSPDIELGICLPCYKAGWECEEFSQYVDYFVVMGYDQCGPWSGVSGYHGALKPQIVDHINHLIDAMNIPSHKIILAIPVYGRIFGQCSGKGEKFRESSLGSYGDKGIMDYNDIVEKGMSIEYDPVAVSNYAVYEGDFISFDGLETVEAKIDWLKSVDLGGIAIWNISGDAKNIGHSILRRIASIMRTE